jgi:Phosphodiester glycosidase
MYQYISRTKRQAQRRRIRVQIISICLLAVLFSLLVLLPAFSPSVGSQMADLIRSVVGPGPVAVLETVSFRIRDQFNQVQSSIDGGKMQISVAQQGQAPLSLKKSTRTAIPQPEGLSPAAPMSNTAIAAPAVTINDLASVTPTPSTDVVTADPQIGWQAYGPTLSGQPLMAQSVLTLDPQRPYTGIVVVRIDISKLQLHMVPGYLEPTNSATVQNAIPNMGLMPKEDLSRLVAGFNGGFKAVNGHYGMMVNGVTLLPAFPGIATVAIFKDGHVQLGTWGQDMFPNPDIVSLRQNCPPILQNGVINPRVYFDDRAVWGDTVGNQEITWRSGLGMSQDGRFLIYAVGNGTTIPILAQALQNAGAENAMQLDINQHYIHFVTYAPDHSNTSLFAVQLLDQMEVSPKVFLVPNSRDFFYLTTR